MVIRLGLGVLGMLFAIGGAVWALGARLPVDHTATASREIPASPDSIFDLISDVERAPGWRPDVSKVQIEDTVEGRRRFVEIGRTGSLPMEITVLVPPHRMVTRITDATLPFGGTWTYEIEGGAEASRVTITERGSVHPAIFRFISRYIIGHDRTMRTYLDHLERHFRADSS